MPFQPTSQMLNAMPQQGQAPSGDQDQLLEQLAHAITEALHGPAPTAPTPPSFQGLSPIAAAAGAMNPQQIPTLINKQMGPAQAQYQQQQAAFEQAMAGRNQALQSGTSLAAAGIRADTSLQTAGMRASPSGKGQLKQIFDRKTGKSYWQEMLPDGQGGFIPGDILGEAAPSYGVLPGIDTKTGQAANFPYNKRDPGEIGAPMKAPGGGVIQPMPPEGFVQQAGGAQATLAGLSDFRGIFDRADSASRQHGLVVRTMRDWIGRQRLGGAIAPDVAGYTAEVRRILFPYVKSITGAAFPESELVRYEQQFPVPGFDSPDLAQQKLDSLARQIAADMKAKYGVAGRVAPAGRKTAAELADELGLK